MLIKHSQKGVLFNTKNTGTDPNRGGKSMSEVETTTVPTPEQTAPEQERTFTQKELDEIVKDRLAREKGKYADYEELKAKATRFDELEEANKSELQKATEKAEALEAELNGLRQAESVRAVRDKISQETGVPANMLTFDTEDECKQQAESILSFAKPQSYPSVKDGGEVVNINKGSARDAFKEFAAQFD